MFTLILNDASVDDEFTVTHAKLQNDLFQAGFVGVGDKNLSILARSQQLNQLCQCRVFL